MARSPRALTGLAGLFRKVRKRRANRGRRANSCHQDKIEDNFCQSACTARKYAALAKDLLIF
ncbi:hypothetical protein BIWAKO_04286 [Bosea sp. BIWAKO-01]|nr:hypothetical protein BIWAKO_04286 [Bosea sp. BIWAKO-01]